jgi:putative restriction endonuclease
MRKNWSYLETALCLKVYLESGRKVPTKTFPGIIELVNLTSRTADSIILKMANFRSLDDSVDSKGMAHVSELDRIIWSTLEKSPRKLKEIWDESVSNPSTKTKISNRDISIVFDPVKTGVARNSVDTRIGQEAIRSLTLRNYGYACSFCGLDYPDLLMASHIIPWGERSDTRGVLSNVICLCAIHDRAFDRGLLTIDDNYKILVSTKINKYAETKAIFTEISGKKISLPKDKRMVPDLQFLKYHRSEIFQ